MGIVYALEKATTCKARPGVMLLLQEKEVHQHKRAECSAAIFMATIGRLVL